MRQNFARVNGILGIDEAGRGPLAGPVAVGAVYVRPTTKLLVHGLKDSKQLSALAREEWFHKIKEWQKEDKLRYSVSLVSNSVIDREGIVSAIETGIDRCLKKIIVPSNKTQVMLDGGLRAPARFINQKTIIRGDEKVAVIALASIVAKVTRDKHMERMALKYPKYGFEIHKGYGTLKHRKAIKKFGHSPIHRKTFKVSGT
jgi:ribonuclease HII